MLRTEAAVVIEQVMLFSLGFLVAALLALAVAPAFWHRAIRLATRRLEMLLPLSAREVLAGRDLLRAERAVERRKLEQKVEALGAMRAGDLAELGRRAVAVAEKDDELETLRECLALLEAENADLQRELAEAKAALRASSLRCEQNEAEIHHLRLGLHAAHELGANQAVALAELERRLLNEHDSRTLETARAARLSAELETVRLEHAGALERLNSVTAEIVESEGGGEPDRPKHAFPAGDEHLRREIGRLYADLLAYRDAVGPGSVSIERNAALRHSTRDERAILRQRISEVGALAVRMTEAGKSPAPEGETSDDSASVVAPGSEA